LHVGWIIHPTPYKFYSFQPKEPGNGNIRTRLVDRAGFEPATSAMPTLRSYQADLPAQSVNVASLLLRVLLG
jgi:hypothetical protein